MRHPMTVSGAVFLAASSSDSHRLAFLKDQPIPCIETSTHVRIRVAYSDINPVDVQKLNQYLKQPDSDPFVVGYGGSGHLDCVGEDVPRNFQLGQPVAFLGDARQRLGSYSTHVCVDYRLVAHVPPSVDLEAAACIGVAGVTAYEALEKIGLPLKSLENSEYKETLLIIGGAGGVGSWATRLAREIYPNLNIVVTSSSPSGTENWCVNKNGASRVIDHHEITKELPAGRAGSVKHVLCLVEPTPTIMSAVSDVLKPFGHICLVVAGPSIQKLDLGFVFFKSGTIHTETVFSNARNNFLPLNQSEQIANILNLISNGNLEPPLRPDRHDIPGCMDWNQALEPGGVLDVMTGNLNSDTKRNALGKLVMKIT